MRQYVMFNKSASKGNKIDLDLLSVEYRYDMIDDGEIGKDIYRISYRTY
jgi:hypothetical protein